MDRRSERRQSSRKAILAAIERLKNGIATHPRHIGITVRITNEAVAREARRSSATLYRFPDLVEAIRDFRTTREQRGLPPAEQRRKSLLGRIEQLEARNALLLAENLHLTRALAKFDPTLGRKTPTDIDTARQRKSARKRRKAG